jgi:hypothetical protein
MPKLKIAVNGGEEKPNIPGDGVKNGVLAPPRLKNRDRYYRVTPYGYQLTLDKVREDLQSNENVDGLPMRNTPAGSLTESMCIDTRAKGPP